MGRSKHDSNICSEQKSHRILKDMTPEEAFSGKKPNVEHLRISRCYVYIHIPKDKRKKIEPSGKKGIFLDIVNPPKPTKSIF